MTVLRLAVIPLLTHPGYSDAYYYFIAADRLASGHGLTLDFIWNLAEAPGLPALPIPALRFWMPLATAIQSAGITLFGPILDPLRAAQLAIALVAIAIPPASYLLARRLGANRELAALAGFIAGIGGVDAVAWSSLDNFAPLALVGTLLFAALPGVARGTRRDIIVAGLALGGCVLARADGAIYALAPLLLVRRAPRAVIVTLALGAVVAAPWYLRDLALGIPQGQLARAMLLVRYDEFFRIDPPTLERFLGSLDLVLRARLEAFVPDLLTFLFATLVVLGPIALVAASRRADPIARGWLAVTAATFLTQWLLFTLHSTRGSLAHSLAGIVPAAVVLALVQIAPWLVTTRRVAAFSAVVATLALAAISVEEWKSEFDPAEQSRLADIAAGAVQTPVLVANAPAWRYDLDGPAIVTPAEGIAVLQEVARRYGARTLVLEPGHFSAYDALYDGREGFDWLVPLTLEGPIRIWQIELR